MKSSKKRRAVSRCTTSSSSCIFTYFNDAFSLHPILLYILYIYARAQKPNRIHLRASSREGNFFIKTNRLCQLYMWIIHEDLYRITPDSTSQLSRHVHQSSPFLFTASSFDTKPCPRVIIHAWPRIFPMRSTAPSLLLFFPIDESKYIIIIIIIYSNNNYK